MFQRIKRLFSRRSLENPAVPLSLPWFGPPTLAGVHVNEYTALTYSAFWCGVRTISVDVASLKIRPFVSESAGGCKPATDHWSYRLVYHTPDGQRPAIRFWASIVQHALTWGNGYAFIERDRGGRGIAFHLLPPDKVTPRIDRPDFYYDWHGQPQPFIRANKILPFNMIHIANPMSFDARVGTSIVAVARESIGLGLGADLSMAAWYGNASRPGGTIETIAEANPQAMTNKREYYDALHQGPMNNGRVGLLLPGDKWSANQLPAPDEAYLNSRRFQIEEIARWFPCPPTKLGEYSHATYSNLEQANMDYLQQAVKPWGDFVAAELNIKLLSPDEQGQYFFRPDYKQLLEADTAARTTYYASGRQWGYLSVNDIRHKEGDNGIGEAGNIYLSPSNMVTDKQLQMQSYDPPPLPPATKQEQPPESTPPPDTKALDAVRAVVMAELGRIQRREAVAIRKAAGKPNFGNWVDDFYEEHEPFIFESLTPSVRAFEAVSNQTIDLSAIVKRWVDESHSMLCDLESVTTSDQRPGAVEEILAKMEQRSLY